MTKLNLLIVEGNIKKDTELFTKAAGSSVSENLKKLILELNKNNSNERVKREAAYTSM